MGRTPWGAWEWILGVAQSLPRPWLLLILGVIKVLIIVAFIIVNTLVLIWLERKVSARIQRRFGPLYVGRPFGWLQTIADTLKLLGKEDIVPGSADRTLFALAPIIVFATALLVWVVIPFGPGLVVADLNIALVFLAAVTSFTVLGVIMSGWGSNNKYATLSAMRGAAVMMSYEVPMVLAVMGVIMLAGSMSTQSIVAAQSRVWFIILQPVGFIVFLAGAFAELNRTPFDLVEAESELVAGFHTEYSGLRWAFFFLSEFANLLGLSALAVTLFLGGWHPLFPLPGPMWFWGPVWFIGKTYAFVLLVMWIKWTLPRTRIDQIMALGWKFLLPVSILNIALTGFFLLVFGSPGA